MTRAKPKSENPEYPDAHPTAPGGMSEKALVAELVGYDWDETDAKALSWPEKIDSVIAHRQERELREKVEAGMTYAEADEDEAKSAPCPKHERGYTGLGRCLLCAQGVPADPDEDDIDPEEFFAEVEEVQANPLAHPINTRLFLGMPDTRDYIFDSHAGAGPSGAERWMTCTESLGASRRFLETLSPNQQEVFATGGTAARQGTTAHAAAESEALLALGRIEESERDSTLLELTIEPGTDEEYSEEMGEYISEYVDLIRTYASERGDDHVMIEQRVEAVIALTCGSCGHEGTVHMCAHDDIHVISGSADAVVLPTKAEPDLVVADLKYGAGIDVDVNENPQVRIYALGVLNLLTDDEGNLTTDVRTLTYIIAQPRLGGIKVYTETLDDLLDWSEDVLSPALTAALTGAGAVYAPSDTACQWCAARGSCAALAEQRVTAGADLFGTISEAEFAHGPGAFPETGELSNERLGSLLTQVTDLVAIKDALREEAQRRMHRGDPVPGFKLVGYTPPKKWEEDAGETLDPANVGALGLSTVQAQAMWQRKMLTPKQAVTVLKKQHGMDNAEQVLHDLMTHPVQKPVIAKEDDRRHEWKGAPPEQMFPDLDEEESDD